MHHNSDSSARRPEESSPLCSGIHRLRGCRKRRESSARPPLPARVRFCSCSPLDAFCPGVSGGLICPCLGPAPRLHQAPHPGRAVRLAWVSPLLSSAFAPGWLEGRMWVARRSHVGGLWVARGSHEGGLWVPTSWLADGLEVAWRWLRGGFGRLPRFSPRRTAFPPADFRL